MRTSNTTCFKRNNSNLKVRIKHMVPQSILGSYQTSLLNYRHIFKSMWRDSSVKKTVYRSVLEDILCLHTPASYANSHRHSDVTCPYYSRRRNTPRPRQDSTCAQTHDTWSQLKAEELKLSTDVLIRRYK